MRNRPFFRIQVEKLEFCDPVQVAVLGNKIYIAFEDLFPSIVKHIEVSKMQSI